MKLRRVRVEGGSEVQDLDQDGRWQPPPDSMTSATRDALRDDARRVAERARAAGVRVRYHEWPSQVHDFPAFAGLIPEGRQAIIRIGEFLLETGSAGGQAS